AGGAKLGYRLPESLRIQGIETEVHVHEIEAVAVLPDPVRFEHARRPPGGLLASWSPGGCRILQALHHSGPILVGQLEMADVDLAVWHGGHADQRGDLL